MKNAPLPPCAVQGDLMQVRAGRETCPPASSRSVQVGNSLHPIPAGYPSCSVQVGNSLHPISRWLPLPLPLGPPLLESISRPLQ